MEIVESIQEKACLVHLSAKNKDDCIMQLAGHLSKAISGASQEIIYQALLEREKLGSTGFEDCIAIPHCKIKGIDEFAVSISVSRKGVPFDSMDGKKARLIFTVIGPDDVPAQHLKILAQISRVTRNPKARRELLHAETPLALKETFIRFVSGGGGKPVEQGKDKLLLIVLYENKFFEDIVNIFLERGISGATVLESSGIKNQISNIPLFSSFLNFLGEQSDSSKTILTRVKENDVPEIVESIEEIMGDLDSHSGAFVASLDISFMKGSLEI
jgi:PTS system nitrogen regulatory IIA component